MLGNFLVLLATALSLLIVDLVVPGVNIANFPAALIAAAAIGLVNSFVKPTLSFMSLPLNFVSLGAFSLVINGLCFWLASILVPGFSVHGILGIILGPVILSLANTFLNSYFVARNPELNMANPHPSIAEGVENRS
ncbi:MAG: phage holin family protein [Nostocaceae cyanobacterium]|nr:phage holin family protein [Nostocaceae cyanobacterium]